MTFNLKFWGTRGSIACPSRHHTKYGGNTSCLEVTAGDRTLILDAGTGIRNLGKRFLKDGLSSVTLMLTHTHWDHINGFPFFTPAYQPTNQIRILAGHLTEQGGIHSILSTQMATPVFPIPLEAMQAKMIFEDFVAGDKFNLGNGLQVITAPLNHANGATGYRITYGGKSMCYVTDTEHVIGRPDQTVLGLIEGADLVIYDSTYTDEEMTAKIGWGHSTWQEAIRLCRAADVRRLALFHHDPDHDDIFMAKIEAEAFQMWDRSFVARDGMEIDLAAL